MSHIKCQMFILRDCMLGIQQPEDLTIPQSSLLTREARTVNLKL